MSQNFFLQLIGRIRTKSPKFFIILRWVGGVLAFVGGGILTILKNGMWEPSFAESLTGVINTVLPYCGALFTFSFLPVDDMEAAKKNSTLKATVNP
jgi:hypothetical protein